MADHRILQNGIRLPFTCENSKYKTDITKGYPHHRNSHLGSVTPEPIYEEDESTLRLEYVFEKNKPDNKIMWLMWYKDGKPTILESAVFDEADLAEVIRNISEIKF